MTSDVQALVSALQEALGTAVVTGQITLNLSEGRVQSIETKSYLRIVAVAPALGVVGLVAGGVRKVGT